MPISHPPGHTVFLGGLRRETTTEEKIHQLMSPFGPISGLRFLGTYAFVNYVEADSAKRAVEEVDGTNFNGARVGARIQGQKSRSEAEAVVFVGGLHMNATEGFVRNYFEPFGEIYRVIIKDRGFGFLHFAKMESAEAAVKALHGICVEGRGTLTVRIQTEENRQQTTKVRDVVDGQMQRKENFAQPQSGLEVFIGGFGIDAGDELVETAIRQLCSQYGELESITTHVSSGIVRFKSYEATQKFAEDFKFGAKWGDRDLKVSIQEVANAATYNGEAIPSVPNLNKNQEDTPYVSISGFPKEFTSDDISGVIAVLFVNRSEPNSFVLPGEGTAVIKCESEADKQSLLAWGKDGIPWGGSKLVVSEYYEAHKFDRAACLSITRIASTVNRREITVLFGLYGEIANVSKITKGTANVLFKQRVSVDKAFAAVSGYVLDGIPIELHKGYFNARERLARRQPPPIEGERYAPYSTKQKKRPETVVYNLDKAERKKKKSNTVSV